MYLNELLIVFLGFGGIGSLVAALISALKFVGIVTKGKVILIPDGQSGNAQVLLNLALFVFFVATKLFAPEFDFEGLDAKAAEVASYGLELMALLAQIAGARLTYEGVLKPAAPALFSYAHNKTAVKAA